MPPTDSPIIVTGMARSGTTWVQWFLSQHPRIHIHGQPPARVADGVLWDFYDTLREQACSASLSNADLGHPIAHYAGSDPERTCNVMAALIRDWLTGFGPEKPRWGIRWPWLAADADGVEMIEGFWPDARWVVCIRDPFLTLASLKNTYSPKLTLETMHRSAANWIRICRFVETHDGRRTCFVQIDKLAEWSPCQRRDALAIVLECIREEPHAATDAFVNDWPVVHKVKPDRERTFALTDADKRQLLDAVPDLGPQMERMGYSI